MTRPLKALELLWIVLFRFPILPGLWASALIAVNLAAVVFLDTIYGQMTLGAALAGIALMIGIYLKMGFVRLLGLGHILWVPMLLWLAWNMPDQAQTPGLHAWALMLIIFNSASLVIDSADVVRYLRGETEPHYTW